MVGDQLNVLIAAAAWNFFTKWMRDFIVACFLGTDNNHYGTKNIIISLWHCIKYRGVKQISTQAAYVA